MDAINELIRYLISVVDRIKTRLAGYIVVLLGTLLAMGPQLQQLISAKQLALVTIVSGVIVALIGHYNAGKTGV